jgi:hypothetical protein
MRGRLVLTQEIWAGLVFIALGAATLLIARSYDIGTTMRMGPGYFPILLGAALLLLGAASCLRAVLAGTATPIGDLPLRPVLFITASAVAFALLIDRAGLAIATFAASILASLAGRHLRVIEALAIAVLLAGFTALLFVTALGLPVTIWPANW